MAAISANLNSLLRSLASSTLPRTLGMCDPVGFEIERMQAILGPFLPSLAGKPGPLRTRADVRTLVSKMRPSGFKGFSSKMSTIDIL